MDWGSLDWGSVADWFAAVGTVGALILGMVVLLHEQRLRRRQHADALVVNFRHDGNETFVVAYNAGSLPILELYVTGSRSSTQRFGSWPTQVAPLERLEFRADNEDRYLFEKRWWAHITDGRGVKFRRNIGSGRYYRS